MKPDRPSRTPWPWLALSLAVALLVPIWTLPYFPSQDGPSHLYNTLILLEWNDTGGVYPEYYDLDLSPVPNWAGTGLLYLLMLLLPPLAAEKVLITLYVAGMTAAWRYWLAGFRREPSPLVLLGPLLATSFPLYKGFYSFCLSLPLFLLALGYAWRHRRGLDLRSAAALHLILVLTYFGHLVSFCMAAMMAGAIGFFHMGRAGWKLRRALAFPLWLAPAAILPLSFLPAAGESLPGRWSPRVLLRYFVRGEWLVSLSDLQLVISCGVMLLIAGSLVLAAARARREGSFPGRRWALVVCFLIGVALYGLLPRGMLGGWNLTERLAIYPVLVIAPLAAVRLGRGGAACAAALIVAMTAGQAAIAYSFGSRMNALMDEYLVFRDRVAPRSVILALRWDLPDHGLRIRPFLHAPAYYAMTSRSIDLGNHEAKTRHFQIRFDEDRVALEDPASPTPAARSDGRLLVPPHAAIEREPGSIDVGRYAGGIDYLIIWNMPMAARAGLLLRYEETYEVVAERGRTLLLRRRDAPPSP